MKSVIATAFALFGCAFAPDTAAAQLAARRAAARCADHAPEAARRSGLPVDVIARVMRAESAGDPRARSHKGAMGCMQIMPGTWSYLTRRHALDSDPWDPRMNMIGGALYLAEMVAEFGLPGAYSAYNAGPGRYRRYIAQGVPLPAETIAYTAQLSGNAPRQDAAPLRPRWQEAALFIMEFRSAPTNRQGSAGPRTSSAAPTPECESAALFPLHGARCPE